MIKHSLLIFVLLLISLPSLAEDFSGVWKVHVDKMSVTFPPDLREIKFPVLLKIEKDGSKLRGEFQDQYGVRKELAFAEVVNDGTDLIFCSVGSTMENVGWMPIHQAKFEEGQLKGVTYCSKRKCFDWTAVKEGDTGSITKRGNTGESAK